MSQAVKVGLFMTACLVVLAYFVLRIEDFRLFGPEGEIIEVAFDSVAGLDEKAAVRVAGVRVGQVEAIRLEGRRARVTLRLDEAVPLTAGTRAAIASQGLLGDKHVELIPGPAGAPPLAAGEVIEGETPVTFDQAMAKLTGIADSVEQVTRSVTGEEGDTAVARLLTNLEATSAEIRALIEMNREEVAATVANMERLSSSLAAELPRLTRQLRELLAQVDGVVAENRGDLRESMEGIREITSRVQVSVDHLNEITGRLARGEGTMGKLLTQDTLHDELVGTLESVETGVQNLSSAFGKIQQFKLDLGFQGTYLEGPDDTRTAFSLRLDPESDRFYLVELVDDPRGETETRTDVVTVTNPDGSTETTTIERVTNQDKLLLSAQFGFRFGAANLRAGIIESSGGAGVDYKLFDDRLLLSLDAFEFGREEELDPHLRLTGRWLLHPNVFLVGGYDDFLVPERESAFLGAGIRWRDDDLKYLLGSIPRF